MSTNKSTDLSVAPVPVTLESLQAIEVLFVGHVFFHLGSEDAPPVLSFADDWDEALLTRENAVELVGAGMSHEWAGDIIAEKIASTGAAMLHVFLVEGPLDLFFVVFEYCDPRCPSGAKWYALLSPPMGSA